MLLFWLYLNIGLKVIPTISTKAAEDVVPLQDKSRKNRNDDRKNGRTFKEQIDDVAKPYKRIWEELSCFGTKEVKYADILK